MNSERAPALKLLSRRYTVDGRTGVLEMESQQYSPTSRDVFDSHIVCFACCKALDGQDEDEENE